MNRRSFLKLILGATATAASIRLPKPISTSDSDPIPLLEVKSPPMDEREVRWQKLQEMRIISSDGFLSARYDIDYDREVEMMRQEQAVDNRTELGL